MLLLSSKNAIVVGLLVILGQTLPAQAGLFKRSPRPVRGQYIVVLKDQNLQSVGASQVDDQIESIISQARADAGPRWKNSVKGFVARMSRKEAIRLSRQAGVALVEEDGYVYANETQTNVTWGLDRVDQKSLPLNGQYNYFANGAGVNAYIIDTGIRASHIEFSGRVLPGFTAFADGGGTNDCNGHGTHVAGTVGGTTYGIAKKVNLIPVRVLDCSGSGTISGVISGVDWVTNQYRMSGVPSVANLSLGGGASSALDTAVQNSISAGVTYVVAAGNDNKDACSFSPARVGAALTVGSTTSSDARSSFSNFGTCLDLFAPGSSITSSSSAGDTATATYSGTSMATPHVAGAAALYLSAFPGATPSQVASALTSNATANVVTGAGTGSPNRLLYTAFIASNTPSDSIAPTATLTAPESGMTLTGTVALKATALDNEGGSGVAKVDFYVDNQKVGEDSSSPYELSWNSISVVNGSHTFYAVATDKAGNLGSSNVTNATVSNSTTVPQCSQTAQLLNNPGFESGASVAWSATSAVITNSTKAPARSGTWKAWLNGYGRTSTNTLYQQITIPVNACSVKLKFWLRVATSEPAGAPARDTLRVSLNTTGGSVIKTLATFSNRDNSAVYVEKTFDVTAHRGQTLRVSFLGIENPNRATSFLIDDTDFTVIY